MGDVLPPCAKSTRDQGWFFRGGSWMLATVGLTPAAVTKLHFSKRAVLAEAAGVGVQSGSLGG